jgi:hypothetical protein
MSPWQEEHWHELIKRGWATLVIWSSGPFSELIFYGGKEQNCKIGIVEGNIEFGYKFFANKEQLGKGSHGQYWQNNFE